MSENEEGTEKTEQPTEKRLREAREQGNIPHSRELATDLAKFRARDSTLPHTRILPEFTGVR